MQQIIADGKSISVQSELDSRLRRAIARIVNDASFDDAFVLEDIAHAPGYNRQFEDWSGDISGRYIGALALCSTYTGEDYPQMQRIAQAVPQFQRPTGLVGVDQSIDTMDFKVVWGQGRLLLGLREYCSVFSDQRLLDCAKSIGDYYVHSLPYWSRPEVRRQESYTCYTQGLLSVVQLYRATHDRRYLETAMAMGDLIPNDIDGVETERDNITFEAKGRHSHGYLSTLLGLLALYEETSDANTLERVQKAHTTITASRVFADGSPPEYFPWSHRDEGCSTADWLMINLGLGRITGEARYFESAERIWRNGLYGNQAANGGFCHHHFDEIGFTGGGNEAWWCCAYHGPKAFYEIMRHLVTWDENGITVQMIEPIEVELANGVKLAVKTDYPASGHVEISVTQAPDSGVPLLIRAPEWASISILQVNGQAISAEIVGGYLRIPDRVRSRSTITLDLDYGLRLENGQGGRRSFWYGPLLLAAESPAGALEAVVVPPPDASGKINLPYLDGDGVHFKIVGIGNAAYRLPLESVSLNRPQTAHLRPLAEQTNHTAPPPAPINLTVIEANTPLLMTELERALRA